VTEADTSGKPAVRAARLERAARWLVSDMCLHKRSCRIGGRWFCSNADRHLPLGVVLKREMKGIWWMPWH
jgi:hypothetical protein